MIDPTIVETILGGVLGLTVLGVTQVVKNFLFKPPKVVPKLAGYVISLAISAAATAYYLISSHTWAIPLFAGYTLYVWAVANGIFKATHTPTI
jgi:hypothetical protein